MSLTSNLEAAGHRQPDAALGAGVILRVTGLTKVFRSGSQEIAPLDAIDLTVAHGQMVAIAGPSGAGKSTLLHLVGALDTPTNGEVYFAGNSLRSFSELELSNYRNRSVGFVWQRHHLLPDFTAEENVAMPLLIRGEAPATARSRARVWLEEVGLAGRSAQHAGQLSGGEQQRVAIARALVTQPSLLLADEPTGDLDEANAEVVFELMQRLHHAHGLTCLVATHNLSLARRADRVFTLQCGKLTEQSSAMASAMAVAWISPSVGGGFESQGRVG